MPIRNPFSRRPGINIIPAETTNDENNNPNSGMSTPPAFEKVDTMGSRSSLSIDSRQSHDTGEYKMSVVNDSGVYLPPSPTEKSSFWGTRRSNNPSTTSVARTSIGESEPFAISRESFDSYRRSFDISARSPINHTTEAGRQSLDSARLRYPRASMGDHRRPEILEEKFEDVGLNDDHQAAAPLKARKKGFFSKFGEGDTPSQQSQQSATPPSSSRFHIMGRKRGQSGQGAELGNWKAPETTVTKEVEEIH